MRGYRFYHELENKNRKGEKSKGTCVAVLLQEDGRYWSPLWLPRMTRTENGWSPVCEAVTAIFDQPNSPVASTAVSLEYLEKETKRVSEAEARKIHPALFEYLGG